MVSDCKRTHTQDSRGGLSMNSDHGTAGDYAYNDARAALKRIYRLEDKLDRAETRINYLGHVINALLTEIYGDEDDIPEDLATVINLANENW